MRHRPDTSQGSNHPVWFFVSIATDSYFTVFIAWPRSTSEINNADQNTMLIDTNSVVFLATQSYGVYTMVCIQKQQVGCGHKFI